MDDPKSKQKPHPEVAARRGAADEKRRDSTRDGGLLGRSERKPLDPEELARAERLIRSKGLHAARQLDPSIAGHCIECGIPVEGNRAFCSDVCITRRVTRNRAKVAAIAEEAGPKKPRRG
jgi:Uncharacterized protein containing a Zn-ribbon (DUF2116)